MERKFIAIFLVAIVLTGVLWHQLGQRQGARLVGGAGNVPSLTAFADAPPSSFARFDVLREDYAPVTLLRDEASGRWQLSTEKGLRELDGNFEWRLLYPSRNETVPEFKADVAGIFVGSNKELWPDFGLTAMAPRVRFMDASGEILEDFHIGMRQAPDGVSSFVRKEGSTDVFSIALPIHDNFVPRDEYEWRRKLAVDRIAPGEVAAIIVEHSQPKLSFRIASAGDQAWAITSPSFDGEKVARHTRVLRAISKLNRAAALAFPQEADSVWGEAAVLLSIKVELKDGSTAGPIVIGPAWGESPLDRLCRAPLLQDTFLLEKAVELVDRPEAFLAE